MGVNEMRKTMLVLGALFALLVAAPAAPAATSAVSITKAGFVPSQLSLKQGDSVTFTNQDTVDHQVSSQDAAFASPVLKPAATFSYTFAKAGKFTVKDLNNKKASLTVTVAGTPAPADTVSLSVAPALTTFGAKVSLNGALSNQKSGEQVTVESQQAGATSFTKLMTVTTTTNGAFTYSVQPLKNTAYQVRYKNVTSAAVTVRVRPAITLGKVAPRRFTVRVRAGDSFAGKTFAVQRFNTVTRHWVLVRTALLRTNTTGVAPTVISSVTFTLAIKARTKLRVVLGSAQVGSSYAAGVSNSILV